MTDRNGREIMVGDLLRSRHFVDPRHRKQMYLYRVVVAVGGNLKAIPVSYAASGEYDRLGCVTLSPMKPALLSTLEIIDGCGPDGKMYWYDRPRRSGGSNFAR